MIHIKVALVDQLPALGRLLRGAGSHELCQPPLRSPAAVIDLKSVPTKASS